MKELSIEEKARRYDEAKYIMKEYLESGNAGVIAENTIKKAFPELAGSEDERIRKALINGFNKLDKSAVWYNGITNSQILDWLEKQGEQKLDGTFVNVDDVREDFIQEVYRVLDADSTNDRANQIIDAFDTLPTVTIEKQGEKPTDKIQLGKKYKCIASPRYSTFMVDKIYKPEDKFLCSLMNFCSDCFEPIEGEQKPDTNCPLSWSETDEKMLQSLEGIVKDYWAKAEQEKNEIKIREASNVSNFLKTIQKSPLCWIKCSDELPNKDGIYLVVTDGRHNDVYDMARYDSIEGWHKASEIIYWMPIPQLNNKSVIEQKPAGWHREDEQNLNACLGYIRDEFLRRWLIDVIHSKYDKPSWSEEDNEHLERILKELENQRQRPSNRPYLDEIVSDYYWLNSLRPQNTWKPSDEQMEAIKDAIDFLGCTKKVREDLKSLYEQLKTLREE